MAERVRPLSPARETVVHIAERHTSDLKTGFFVAALPDAWYYKVSVRTGWPGVSTLRVGEIAILISNLNLDVVTRKNAKGSPFQRHTVAETLSNQSTMFHRHTHRHREIGMETMCSMQQWPRHNVCAMA